MRKKRALVDVDGVVADFSIHLINESSSRLTPEDITEWDIFNLIGLNDGPEAKKKALGLMEETDWWDSLPLLENAQVGIEALSKTHDIVWVTSPWPTCKGWDISRRNWIKKHFKDFSDHVVITESKFVVAGDLIIDDRINNVVCWADHHPTKDLKRPIIKKCFSNEIISHSLSGPKNDTF
jgi:5'(3')-deoxyribonucleotidase